MLKLFVGGAPHRAFKFGGVFAGKGSSAARPEPALRLASDYEHLDRLGQPELRRCVPVWAARCRGLRVLTATSLAVTMT